MICQSIPNNSCRKKYDLSAKCPPQQCQTKNLDPTEFLRMISTFEKGIKFNNFPHFHHQMSFEQIHICYVIISFHRLLLQ